MWADTAYRSVKNEAMLARRGFISRIHRKKPKGKTMPEYVPALERTPLEIVFAITHSINGCIETRILSPITSEPTRIAIIGAAQLRLQDHCRR